MLRKLIESKTGPLTDAKFAEIMDLTTSDIKVNNLRDEKKTSLSQAVEIAVICVTAAARGRVVA